MVQRHAFGGVMEAEYQIDGIIIKKHNKYRDYNTVDFYCPSEKLAVELDGAEHYTPEGSDYDEERDKYINSLSINVLRYENGDIYNN